MNHVLLLIEKKNPLEVFPNYICSSTRILFFNQNKDDSLIINSLKIALGSNFEKANHFEKYILKKHVEKAP